MSSHPDSSISALSPCACQQSPGTGRDSASLTSLTAQRINWQTVGLSLVTYFCGEKFQLRKICVRLFCDLNPGEAQRRGRKLEYQRNLKMLLWCKNSEAEFMQQVFSNELVQSQAGLSHEMEASQADTPLQGINDANEVTAVEPLSDLRPASELWRDRSEPGSSCGVDIGAWAEDGPVCVGHRGHRL